jgi:hypothetical protein
MSPRPGGTRRRAQTESRPAPVHLPRKHARFVVNLPVQCTRLATRATHSWRGRTADISGGGFSVELPTRLPPGTRVAIQLRTGIGPMRMEADVVWTRRVTGRPDVVRHGLCLADRSELLDLPVGVLLGQWLKRRAQREVASPPRKKTAGRKAGRAGA